MHRLQWCLENMEWEETVLQVEGIEEMLTEDDEINGLDEDDRVGSIQATSYKNDQIDLGEG